ncbi:MAG: hypothetical protein NTY55_11220 [Flavobacteriia bacterium]|nr:hypothetical protein [Flavobacteriia bacterium]
MIQSNENMAKIFDKANSSTKQKIALAYLGKVIKNHKKHILDAFTREGILLDADISDKMLISKIQNTLLQKNEQANNLKKSLAILILAKKDNFSDFFSLSKNKTPKTPKAPKQPKTPKVKAPKEAKTPKVKDGNMFTRTFKKGEDGTSKAGNFYRDNKEAINILGDTLIGGIATKWGKNAVNNNINNDVLDSSIENVQEPKKTPYLKYALIVGGIAVAGFIIYKIVKR